MPIKKSLLDTPLGELLKENPKLANMTPRDIINHLQFLKCRLTITPGHACKQQLPFVTFRSLRFEIGSIFVLDSCIWYGEHWVIQMDVKCAMLLCVSPVRVVQNAATSNEIPITATIPSPELCSCMEIMPAAKYLELIHTVGCCHKD